MGESEFRTTLGENIFRHKYELFEGETWAQRCDTVVEDVCGDLKGETPLMSREDREQLKRLMREFKFLPGGRYLYYGGRPSRFWSNCLLLRAEEDTREEWANLIWRSTRALMTGAGIGVDYSVFRPSNSKLGNTGGLASGPIPWMEAINSAGKQIRQGGSRRSAIYGSLAWNHRDAKDFLKIKNWHELHVAGTKFTVAQLKEKDFDYPAPLDGTNISLNYDDQFLKELVSGLPETYLENCRQALMTGEPGFSFNFGAKQRETLRNAPVAASTNVLTKDGYKPVRDIVGKKVEVWTGKQWAVTTFKRTKVMSKTVRVTLGGRRSIVCDPEHPFLVERYVGAGRKTSKPRRLASVERVPASELQVGDIVASNLPMDGEYALDKVAYTLGYVYGDGSFRSKRNAELTLCTAESKKCLAFMERDLFSSVNMDDSMGFVRGYIKADDMWMGRDKKTCPEDLSIDEIPSFIAGLTDSDGNWCPRNKCVRLSSVNKGFLKGVRRLLERIGIKSGLIRGGISTYGKKLGWMLVVYSCSTRRFKDIIPTCRVIPLIEDDYVPYRDTHIRVVSVESDEDQDVYCCDVGVDEHSFLAEGVLVSNCTELTSEDDSDICNLGSVNLGAVDSLEEFELAVRLGTKFLLCGTIRGEVPYPKVLEVREKNRRLGLGLMGIHEWLLSRGGRYEVTPDLHSWLAVFRDVSREVADKEADAFGISRPKGVRAIAPNGTIGIIAGTTTGVEPIYSVAYKRRYLGSGNKRRFEYVVDATAEDMIKRYGLHPDDIETAVDLGMDIERRIKFQADVQDYVDHAISSTINLPAWGSEHNNEDRVEDFARTLAEYAPRLRGFTAYPDGARGGQPITTVSYAEAMKHRGQVFYEAHDACKGGVCGI